MPKKKANSQFPGALYVVYEPEDDGPGFFTATPHLADHAWPNGKIRVGVYRLETVGDLVAEPTIVNAD